MGRERGFVSGAVALLLTATAAAGPDWMEGLGGTGDAGFLTAEEQTRLISEEEVVRQAERQSEEIVVDARPREREIRVGAVDYADDILNTHEVNLTKFIAAVQRGRDRLQGREEAEVG